MSRRSFLDSILFTSLAAAGVAALSPIPFFLIPPPELRPARVKLGPASRFQPGVAESFAYGRKSLMALHEDGVLRVIDRHCTHQGCTVAWVAQEKRFECPCHGAHFAPDGTPLRGPHGGPLASIPHRITPDGELEVGE